jgi:hypothetical protein
VLADEKVMPEKKPILVLAEEKAMSDEKVCRRKTSRSRSPPPPSFLPGYELPSRLRLALRLRGGDAESGIATAGEHVDKMSGCARRRSVYTTIATCRAHPAARRHCERLALFGNHANAETAVSALGETCLIWQPCEC